MARGIHYVARGGIAAFAISALDIAFWDVMLKQKGWAVRVFRKSILQGAYLLRRH